MRQKKIILLIIGAVLICFDFGCHQKINEKRVVARVNDYAMTVEDFKDEISHSFYIQAPSKEIEDLLDLAVRKQILIQEAQRLGLDRQKSFMKTIERYWSQTLIRELLQKETEKIYKNVAKEKQKEAMGKWMDQLYKKAVIKTYKNVLKEMKEE